VALSFPDGCKSLQAALQQSSSNDAFRIAQAATKEEQQETVTKNILFATVLTPVSISITGSCVNSAHHNQAHQLHHP
jgi:hypothetical protein